MSVRMREMRSLNEEEGLGRDPDAGTLWVRREVLYRRLRVGTSDRERGVGGMMGLLQCS